METWDVHPGMLVLLEPIADESCLTGAIVEAGPDTMLVDLEASSVGAGTQFVAAVSVFTPESLWQFQAEVRMAATEHDLDDKAGGRVARVTPTTPPQRIERRASPRTRVRLPAMIGTPGDATRQVKGETVDVSTGGVRIRTDGPLVGDGTWVTVVLPDGGEVQCQGELLGTGAIGELRFAFRDPPAEAVAALERLTATT
jgi:PilZ domain